MSVKFGTSGLRGLSRDLEGRTSAVHATAFARYLLETGQAHPGADILIGRDFRASSPAIAAICTAALQQEGFTVLDCGALPTPALALYGLEKGAAALMITGSHIPADRNGIKFYRPDGEIAKDDELAIGRLAEAISAQPSQPEIAKAHGADRAEEVQALFQARSMAILPAAALSGLRIGVYQHSSVARDLFVTMLEHYGADVVALGRSEEFIPVDTEAVSPETIALLKAWASQHRLDAIVSADGDGDRPLVADETGQPLRGDLLGLITATFCAATVVVTPVTSNSGLERTQGLTVLRTRVGSPFVIAGMQQAVADGRTHVMGFEANGGVLTATAMTVNGTALKALPTRDSVLPILAVLACAAKNRQPLSRIASDVALPVALSDRLENIAVETSAALMAHLRASRDNLAAFLKPIGTPKSVSEIDGLRITLGDDSIVHFRPSGNAPEMRCYVEADSERQAKALLDQGLDLIRDWGAQKQP